MFLLASSPLGLDPQHCYNDQIYAGLSNLELLDIIFPAAV